MNATPRNIVKPGRPGLVTRCLVWGALWHAINAGDLRSWVVGVPAVGAAAFWDAARGSGTFLRIHWQEIPALALYFARKSWSGGLDVAFRVMSRRIRVAPGFIRYATSLPPGPQLTLFINLISLLPGTVAAAHNAGMLVIHALDKQAGVETDLRELELRVARLFGNAGKDKS